MSALPQRRLGQDGPLISAMGFGAMGLSASYGKMGSDEERFEVLDRCFALGVTFWDTADVYGDNEELLGKWFRRTGQRDRIFLCTKFAMTRGPDGKLAVRNDPSYIKEACDRSLERLGVRKIDLYYPHRVDQNTPIEKTIEAMVDLKNQGKIGHIGLSEVSAATLRRACKVHPISAVQVEYSPFALDIERPDINLLQTCRELGVAVVAYSPLGRGFLTGQYKSPDDFEEGDFRKTAPRYSKENFPRNLELVKQIEKTSKTKKCTSGQLSLAWLLAQGDDIIPIPGTKKIKYLEENVKALEVELTPEETGKLRKEIESVELVGGRYGEHLDQYSFGDTAEL